jgi:hypothetical protein
MMRQFKLTVAMLCGAWVGCAIGTAILLLAKPWWEVIEARIWPLATLLFLTLSGLVCGAELGMRWANYRTIASTATRVGFRMFVVAAMSLLVGVSEALLSPVEPWGFGLSVGVALVAAFAMRTFGSKIGTERLVDVERSS